MYKRMVAAIFAILISSALMASDADLENKINALNEASMNSIGISLNALAYLVKASPNNYMPLWHLEESGDIKHIKELEKAGYVDVKIINGLPNGQILDEKHVNVIPLHIGREVQRCMLAIEHNKSTQPTQ